MTRADFYVGTGPNAIYVGSVMDKGDNIPNSIKRARTPEKYQQAVTKFIKKNSGVTVWTWSWNSSLFTDYAYWLDNGKLYVTKFGIGYRVIEQKRGRPAAFDRNWDVPMFPPTLLVQEEPEVYTVGQTGAVANPDLKITLS